MIPSRLPQPASIVAVDTETSGLFIDDGARTCVVSVAYYDRSGAEHAYAWPFNQGDRNPEQPTLGFEPDPNLPKSEWDALLSWLVNQRLVMHNAKFDMHMLRIGTAEWEGVELENRVVWDTMLVNKELDPIHLTGLKPTAVRLGIGEDVEQGKVKEYLRKNHLGQQYDMVPWDVIEPYAINDALYTLRLWTMQIGRVAEGEADRAQIEREMEMMRVLYKLETRGIAFDSTSCLKVAGELRIEQQRLETLLPFDNTVPAAKKFFYDRMGIKPLHYTEGGQPKLDDYAIGKMVEAKTEHAKTFQLVRKISIALDMWYLGYPSKVGEDGRLRTSYRQIGTVSGRFSVERVNLQAIPHASTISGLPASTPTPRQFFHAKEGYELWELDLQQAELRVAARMANCEHMLTMIEQNQDLHAVTARELFGIDEQDENWFKYRQISKRGNFSLIFGVGAEKFRDTLATQAGIDMTLVEAKRFIDAWRALYPEFTDAINRASKTAERYGYVNTAAGRRRWFKPDEVTHKAFNQQVQGALAEFAKLWALETERKHPGVLVLLIHDSEVLEIMNDHVVGVINSVADLGARIGTDWFDVRMGVDSTKWKEHN
jgi:DNA polymerase-1